MFSRKRTFDDRSRLSRDANKALDEVLEADEHVRVIVPGTYGSALIASDTRGFVWKRNHLSVYPFENLTTVAFGAGLVLKWAQFRGPSIGTAALVVAAAGPVRAAYQATADSNTSAFTFNCIRVNDTYPARMLSSALAGYRNLGYATTGYSGTSFSKGQVLSRTLNDWGYYVRSHASACSTA